MAPLKYGRKSGYLRHLQALALLRIGRLNRFAGPAPAYPGGRTIFVCKGNIARSAYAEYRARALGMSGLASAGVMADSGHPANPDAVTVGWKRGVYLGNHASRHVDELALRPLDRVFAFEIEHARQLAETTPARVFLLGLWAELVRPYIEDPFNRPLAFYDQCFGIIDNALERLWQEDLTDRPATEELAPAVPDQVKISG